MMSLKFLKNFSFFFSILLLLVFTFLFSFTLFISEKPMKINILNLFDRESQILKKKKVREIGNIYLSFNKISKKFEFLIEDILISNFFFPTVMISLDLSLSKDFFNTSLKLFDGELSFREIKKSNLNTNSPKTFENINNLENMDFINLFSEIEVINNRLIIFDKNNAKFEYIIDLTYNNKNLKGLLSQYENPQQNLSFMISNHNYFSSFIEANNFNVKFIESFFIENYVSLSDLKISGKAEINGENFKKIDNLDFDLNLEGSVEYLTYNGLKKIEFSDDLLIGSFDNNNIDISRVSLWSGDSVKTLPEMLSTFTCRGTFWLDAHYSGGETARMESYDSPIIQELSEISKHPVNDHVIVIDDADLCFKGYSDYPNFNQIKNKILEINSDYLVTVKYNTIFAEVPTSALDRS